MDKPLRFNPNSNDHLEWVLKQAYMHAAGDLPAGTEENMDALCDALCNLIGDEAFCKFCEEDLSRQ